MILDSVVGAWAVPEAPQGFIARYLIEAAAPRGMSCGLAKRGGASSDRANAGSEKPRDSLHRRVVRHGVTQCVSDLPCLQLGSVNFPQVADGI